MEIKYTCINPECKPDGDDPFVLTLNLDNVMDEKNIAQMYCPHCKSELKPMEPVE